MNMLNKRNTIVFFSLLAFWGGLTLFTSSEHDLATQHKTPEPIASTIQATPPSTYKSILQPDSIATEKSFNEQPSLLLSELEITQQISSDDASTCIDALAYVWKHIDSYKNNRSILNAVLTLALPNDDMRISGLAELIITMDTPSKEQAIAITSEVNTFNTETNYGEEYVSTDDIRIDASADNLTNNLIDDEQTITPLVNGSTEEKQAQIQRMIDEKNIDDIQQISQLIPVNEEPVQQVITDGLIHFLQQGVGNPQEIINILAENAAHLSTTQLQKIQTTLAQSNDAQTAR